MTLSAPLSNLNRSLKNYLKQDQERKISIFINLFSKGVTLVAQPLIILLISRRFTKVEQGYYYTMSSILAISLFFELGFGVVLTNYTSKLFKGLSWSDKNVISGDKGVVDTFMVFCRKSLLYYIMMFLLFFIALFIYGKVSLEKDGNFHYLSSWMLLIVFASFNLLTIPFVAILSGAEKVDAVQRIRFLQIALAMACIIGALFMGFKLEVLFIEYLLYVLVFFTWFFIAFRRFMGQLLVRGRTSLFSWKKEVLKLQFKNSVSWLATYFIGGFLIPLTFHYKGAVVAGELGMSCKILSFIYNTSFVFLSLESPYYPKLIAEKSFALLNSNFKKVTLKTMLLFFGMTIAFIIIYLLKLDVKGIVSRTLEFKFIVLLLVLNAFNVIINIISTYVRAFLTEPYPLVNLIFGIFLFLSSIFIISTYSFGTFLYFYVFANLFLYFPGFLIISYKEVAKHASESHLWKSF